MSFVLRAISTSVRRQFSALPLVEHRAGLSTLQRAAWKPFGDWLLRSRMGPMQQFFRLYAKYGMEYQPSNLVRKRRHGFMKRMETKAALVYLSDFREVKMTRGNARELARAKNAKKQQSKGHNSAELDGNKGQSLEQRKERDAEIMREKQKKKLEAKS
ncbi:hypothetical protein EMCRGX_G022572 [Ephydatia muelleri]